jgi:hypothetical protein
VAEQTSEVEVTLGPNRNAIIVATKATLVATVMIVTEVQVKVGNCYFREHVDIS